MRKKLAVKQQAEYKGHNWWSWSVELDGPDDELDKVAYAQYTLHPTFPDPVQRVANRRTKFRLKSSGWGEFMIYVEVGYKNGKTGRLEHWLELSMPEGDGPTARQTKSAPPRAGGEAQAKEAAAPTEGQQPHRLFLSHGVADLPFAHALRQALKNYRVEVLTADDAAASLPLEVYLRTLLEKATSACFILSDRPNNWMMREFLAAKDRGLPVYLLTFLGNKFELPGEMDYINIYHHFKLRPVPQTGTSDTAQRELEDSARAAAKRLASGLGLRASASGAA
jgi:hypothetical protein